MIEKTVVMNSMNVIATMKKRTTIAIHAATIAIGSHNIDKKIPVTVFLYVFSNIISQQTACKNILMALIETKNIVANMPIINPIT